MLASLKYLFTYSISPKHLGLIMCLDGFLSRISILFKKKKKSFLICYTPARSSHNLPTIDLQESYTFLYVCYSIPESSTISRHPPVRNSTHTHTPPHRGRSVGVFPSGSEASRRDCLLLSPACPSGLLPRS